MQKCDRSDTGADLLQSGTAVFGRTVPRLSIFQQRGKLNMERKRKNVTYKEARVYLDEMSKYGSVLGLDTIRGLLRELGNPQDDLKFIHIAGTNGKGSVLAYTSTVLSEAGYRIGRYVSPTVVSYLERIQVDGEWIPEERFASLTECVRDAIARMEAAGEHSPTVFEAETAIAFLYFREMKCDLVVLEAGLGGELDATNIVKNTVCAVFTSISRDHLGVIGDTLEEIAENKAGIIKPGCAVVSAHQPECVRAVLQARADRAGAEFTEAGSAEIISEDYRGIRFSYKEFQDLYSPLAGKSQLLNAAAALEVILSLRRMGYRISGENIRRGIGNTVWPGRFTCVMEHPVFLLDGAHNEEAALRLRESVESYFPGRRLIFIMGVFRDKEYEKIADIMCPLASSVYTVSLPDRKRTLPAEELARTVSRYCTRVSAEESTEQAVRKALAEAESEDVILAFGSLSYLGQVKEAVDKLDEGSSSGLEKKRGMEK